MKKRLYAFLSITATAIIALIACKKTIENPGNGGGIPPGDTTTARNFQVVIDSLPGENATLQNLSAIISIINGHDDPVVMNKEVGITYNGRYYLPTLTLQKGNYKLSKIILYQNSKIKFATPYAGSEMAGLVSTPLNIPFTLSENTLKSVTVQVAKVNAGDRAEQFGYPPGSFGNAPPDDPAYIRIRVQPIIRVGEIVYDSIPVSLNVTTWDNKGQMTSEQSLLSPGTNEILLKASATKYQLHISKWGTNDEITLMRNQVQEGMLYSFGGTTQAKKLKEVLTYRLTNGTYVPETKTEYIYDAGGKVTEIRNYLKDANQVPYVSTTDQFTYTNEKVQTAKRYNEKNELIESTDFFYTNEGKLRKGVLTAQNRGIIVNVTYSALHGHTGITGRYLIDADYQFTHYSHSTNYKMTMQGGNMYQTRITSSNGALEEGQLQYDFNINPFIHLNLPDIYFINPSRHNINGQQKTYQVAFPSSEPYHFNYTYDNQGYPTELITRYKNYFTQEHTSTVKTIYRY